MTARRLLLAQVSLVALMLSTAPLAYGKVIHAKVGSFTGADAPGGPFGAVLSSDAVNQTSGDVYVLESNFSELGAGVVDKFNANGEYAKVHITGAKIAGQKTFSFGFRSGVAVDNSAGANKGDVYVSDSENGVVDRFTEAGVFVCQITGRKPISKEESEHECNGEAGSLTPDGSIVPAGVAVDAKGDVYVADEAHGAIDKFNEKGQYESQIKDSHFMGIETALALDPTGDLYVQTESSFAAGGEVVKLNPAGGFVSVLDASETFGVGVDPKTSHVYVDELKGTLGQDIAEYEPSGVPISAIATPHSQASGIAVDGASGDIYVAELFGGGAVAIFGPDVVVPTLTSSPASGVTEASATLHGHLDPDAAHGGGEVTECVFEYGTTTAYGKTAPCTPSPPYAAATDVSAAVEGLSRGTAYHFRLKAANANGPNESEDEAFTTAGLAAIDEASARVSGTEAILHAQINPLHLETTCQVQYVDDASFKHAGYAGASSVPCTPEDLGSGFGDEGAIAALVGLKISTTYHYRFLASNAAGLIGSADRTFRTFGANSFKFETINKEGLPFTQAGGHPYELVTGFQINPYVRSHAEGQPTEGTDGNVKDVITQLPPGLIGDLSATPKCTREQVRTFECSGAAQVGVAEVNLEGEPSSARVGVYNVVPPKGIAAEFAFSILEKANVYLDSKLRSGGDYGVTSEAVNSSGVAGVREVQLRLWGVPAEESHDAERHCGRIGPPCSLEDRVLKPFLRNPTECGGPLTTTLALDSWQDPGEFAEASATMPAITGCEKVPFGPTLQVQPTTGQADAPTGLRVDLHLPQNKEPEALAEGDLRNTSVTLPLGMTTNPSAANGLAACAPSQIGLTSAPGVSPVTFTPSAAECPEAAKVGSVEVDTPLLDHPLLGAVYIASPYNNPFRSLLAIYVAVYDPQTGVVVKLAGHVEPNPETGQLTTTFSDSPQVPFEDFKLDFFEGARAALATPEGCGAYTPSASFTPWSGTPAVSPAIEGFAITSGCVNGFAPRFSAGTGSTQAGAFAPLSLSFARADTDEELAGVTVSLPPGLLARVAGVPLCSDAALANAASKSGAEEAASPSCPEGAQLGTAQAWSGTGPDPVAVSGRAYLTGAYKGGPYGVAVVVPAIAGPFDLGTVVVRAALHIDPNDGHVTAVSDPFPTILKGIPLHLRRVDMTIDRSSFAFNPTSCNPLAATATLLSTGGRTATLSQRFQVGGCNSLRFKPRFTASTQANTSRVNGASLEVKVTAQPGEANIGKVDATLPLSLPSRLTTLQKACTAAQFAVSPTGCPAASAVGTAIARTPVLANPLTGTAYLVSHGGAAFPDLVVVLQSEGITIDLTGHTDIKRGITYSRFETVPDAPISSFELTLPEGPHSVLAANLPVKAKGRLCSTKLIMPTTITAQDGAQVTQSTRISVTGCPKAKKPRRGRAARRQKKGMRSTR